MTHLTDDQLNEVLDGAIFDDSILGHLDACVECQTRLEDLRALFATFESLPEVESPDLTASVMAKLPARSWGGLPIRPTRTWTWLSLAQALGAFAILAWLASSFVLPPEIAAYQPPTVDSLLATVFSIVSSISNNLQTPTFDFQPLTIDLQSTTILTFIISAAVLWLVGNGLLLRAPQRNNR